MTTVQKIADIEAEMARTQKNKATMSHLCILKAKLAKLRREILAPKGAGGGGKPGDGFDVTKSGDARVGLIGFPSVGKSTLLVKMTGTKSEVAAYEFTTLTCIPGTFKYKGCKIQLLDLPGIIEGAKDGKGRGRQVIGVARTCNLILITLDASKPMTHKRIIEKELEGFGIRLNQGPPNIIFKQKERGGVNLTVSGVKDLTHLDKNTVTSVLKEYRILNADVTLRCDATVDELIDVIEGNRIYCPCLYVLNKIDSITIEELELLSRVPHYVPISANHEWNFDELLEKIWEYLNMIRVYTKPRGQVPDYDAPVVVPRNKNTVEEFCLRIHKSLLAQFKYAMVWGSSVKHNPQKVGKEHQLADEDVVQIIKKVG
jgi:small GTP-binding protein